MAPVNACDLYLEGTLLECPPGRLAIVTDSLDMTAFELVEPEEGGTEIRHNVGNYTLFDTASLPGRIESSSALFSAKFSERLHVCTSHI